MIDATLPVLESGPAEETLAERPSHSRSPATQEAVQAELETILSCPSFKSSPRCRDFLKHVVAFAESPGALKERTIGIVIFGRSPDYDTGADAIVRVKANEVRKRLSQYNLQADPARAVAIELSPGSYAPRISVRSEPRRVAAAVAAPVLVAPVANASTASTESRRYSGQAWWIWIAATSSLLVALALGISAGAASASPARRFMHPFFSAARPILCISHPNAYNLERQIVKNKGDAPEALHLRDTLQRQGRPGRIAVADDITEQDLASSPMIAIGGPRYNRWTYTLTQNLRFYFDIVDGQPRIIDRYNPHRYWETPGTDMEKASGDYAVITRLVGTGKTKPILCIAGLRATGTRAGTEAVLSEATLNQLLQQAPENWDKKNLQLVIHTYLNQNGSPVTDLSAATYW